MDDMSYDTNQDSEVITQYGDTNVVDFDSSKYDPNYKGKHFKPWYKRWYVWVLIILTLGGGITGLTFFLIDYNSPEKVEARSTDRVGLKDTFVFDDFEITLGTKISFVTLTDNGQTIPVMSIPATVKNVSEESGERTFNLGYLEFYDLEQNKIKDVNDQFADRNSIAYDNKLQSGKSFNRNLFMKYSGDGEYMIMFKKKGSKTYVMKFDVKK